MGANTKCRSSGVHWNIREIPQRLYPTLYTGVDDSILQDNSVSSSSAETYHVRGKKIYFGFGLKADFASSWQNAGESFLWSVGVRERFTVLHEFLIKYK